MPEPSNLSPDIAAKVLEANVRNIVEKVRSGGTLNASERALMESAAAPKSPLQAADEAAAAAPFLFLDDEIGHEKLEATGEFTGERLLARRPDAYRAVVRMAAEGLSISATARALGVSRNTVAAVREREGISIEQEKKELLRDVRRAARLSVERAIELVPGIQSAKDAAIVAAVMVDKMQLLAGEATSRVERVDASEDKLREMLAALPVLDATILTGQGASECAQRDPASSEGESVCPTASVGNYQGLTPTPCVPVANSLEINPAPLSLIDVIGSYQPVTEVNPATPGGEGGASEGGGSKPPTYLPVAEILPKGASGASTTAV